MQPLKTIDTGTLPIGTRITITFVYQGPSIVTLGSERVTLPDSGFAWLSGSVTYTTTSSPENVTLTLQTARAIRTYFDNITASCSLPATPTSTPTETPTATATSTPTATATDVPTATASATSTPTATATDVPTATASATGIPSKTPTETATDIPTETATAASAESPTATSESTVAPTIVVETPDPSTTSGSTAITLITSDGDAVPDNALVCIGAQCRRVSDQIAAAAATGTTLTFSDLAADTYVVIVTDAAPYDDLSQEVSIGAGETVTLQLTLQRTSAPDAATPITTEVPVPTTAPSDPVATTVPTAPAPNPSTDSGPSPTPGSSGTTGSSGSASAPAAVTSLPKTGSGTASPTIDPLVLLAIVGAALAIVGITRWRRHA